MSFKDQVIRVLTPLRLVKPVEVMTRPIRRPLMHRAMRRFYAQFVKPGELCFDIGANEGDWTHVLAGLGAQVIAVEPQPDLADRLRRRFARDAGVTVVAKGVAETEGTALLTLSEESSQLATMSKAWKEEGRWKDMPWGSTIQVPTTTLDRLIEKFGQPAFCKIDVEGFEEQVLSGLTRPIRVISIEYDTTLMEHVHRCMELLGRLGPAKFNFSPGKPTALGSKQWLSKEELLGMLGRPEYSNTYGDIYARSA